MVKKHDTAENAVDAAKAILLGILDAELKSVKGLLKMISAQNSSDGSQLDKKQAKKMLKALAKDGMIRKEGKKYASKIEAISLPKKSNVTAVDGDTDTGIGVSDQIPLAERLRRTKTQSKKGKRSVKFAEEEVDLDDEIKRLELELQEGGSSDDEESASDEDESEAGETGEKDRDGGVVCLSTLATERINPLPQHLLPASVKRKLKGIDQISSKPKKKAKPEPDREIADAVREILGNYKPRSSEKLPFYCRVCSKQYKDESDFFDHKSSEFHKTAVAMEAKASFCKLCRKQLTSPAQLLEHLKSRPHREQMDRAKTRNAKGGPSRNRDARNKDKGRRQWV